MGGDGAASWAFGGPTGFDGDHRRVDRADGQGPFDAGDHGL